MASYSLDEQLARMYQGVMRPQNGVPDNPTYAGVNLGPTGPLTATQQTAGIQAFLNYCAAQNYKAVFPEVGVEYLLTTSLSLRLCAYLDIEIQGRLRNIGADVEQGLRRAVFKFGNQNPLDWKITGGPFTWRPIGVTVVGSKTFTISAGTLEADSTGQIVGGILMIRSVANYSAADDHPNFMRFSRVTAYNAGTGAVTIEDEIDQAWDCVVTMGGNGTAKDVQDEPLFIAANVNIHGAGSWASTSEPMIRTTMYKCGIDLRETSGESVVFGNGFSRSNIRFKRSSATRKVADIAGNSHFSNFHLGYVTFSGDGTPSGGGDPVNAVVMNERAFGCGLWMDSFEALNFNVVAGLVNFNTCDRCTIDIGDINAPVITTTPLRFGNPVTDGTVQATLSGNHLHVGNLYGGSWTGYYLQGNGAGGQLKDNFIDVRCHGTPSAGAIQFGGDANVISPASRFDVGALVIDATGQYHPTNLVADGISFPGGVTGSTSGQRVRAFA